MTSLEVRIPDIGDAKDVEVIEICVEVGQEIDADDALIVIESDKASMEVPAPVKGTVVSIASSLGDKVNTDDLVLTMNVEETVQPKQQDESPSEDQPEISADDSVGDELDESSKEPATEVDEVVEQQIEVRVPDIGEAKDVVVIELLVEEGATVEKDAPLIVLESDKASMEITAPEAGLVEKLTVTLDQPIEQDMLVAIIRAEIVKTTSTIDHRAESEAPVQQPSTPITTPQVSTPKQIESGEPQVVPSDRYIYAGPAVRRLARELGVDLTKVPGTGGKGRILKDDVHAYVKRILTSGIQEGAMPKVEYPDFTKFGDVELQPMSRMRSVGAQNLARSWLNVVHVTQHDTTDVTELEDYRKQFNEESANDDKVARLTPLPFILRACAMALKEMPQFNASIHPSLKQLIIKKYINLGFAVDTDEGLVVPVIKDVLSRNLTELAEEILTLSDSARRRRLRTEQISGASFTVSSLGQLGGTGFAPVVNAPEVAILGVARMETRPVWSGEAFEPRKILPLSLSYDHRAINGAEGGRFLMSICQNLADSQRLI